MVMSMVRPFFSEVDPYGTSTLGLGARDFRQFVKSQPDSRVIFTLRLAREIVIVTFTAPSTIRKPHHGRPPPSSVSLGLVGHIA